MTTAASENPANRVKPYLMSFPPWVVSSPHERLQARCHRASTPAIPNTTTTRARLAAGEEIASDDDTLDLVGALVDLRDLGVAHEALHRVLARVAVAAEDLHGVGGPRAVERAERHAESLALLAQPVFHRDLAVAQVDGDRR